MDPIIVTILMSILFIVSISVTIKKRKKAGITGMKSGLSSICFYLIGIVNILAYWFQSFGIISWLVSFSLLLLAAYFTKYLEPLMGKKHDA